jgi:hypothetical protein
VRQPLRDIAAAQHGAFTTAQAMSCYSRGELRALVGSGHWEGVFTGTYRVKCGEPGTRLRLSAAGLSIGREVPACLHTAAELHGFGVLDDAVTHVVVRPDEPCVRRPGLWPHQLALAADDLVRLKCGALSTTADRTAVYLARTLPRIDVLPVLDAALAAGVCTPESLAAELARHAGLRGVRQARELVPLAHPAPESPQESRLRLRCHDAGLAPPTPQLRDRPRRVPRSPGADAQGRGGHRAPNALTGLISGPPSPARFLLSRGEGRGRYEHGLVLGNHRPVGVADGEVDPAEPAAVDRAGPPFEQARHLRGGDEEPAGHGVGDGAG